MSIEIPIVIVSYNDSIWLDNCLTSVFLMNAENQKSDLTANVIIVDNASEDNSVRIINDYKEKSEKKKFSRIKLTRIFNTCNEGFVLGTNKGIRIGLKNPDVTHVATLNPDTQVHEQWLSKLHQCALDNKSKKYGMYASEINFLKKLNNIFERSQCAYSYGHVYYDHGACLDIGYKNNFKEEEQSHLFCHCHAASLLSRKMLEEVGLIDCDYWAWYDCPNLGWKARLSGWHPILVTGAKAWHRKSKRREEHETKVERNRILTILRFMPDEVVPIAIEKYLKERRSKITDKHKQKAIEDAKKLFKEKYPATEKRRKEVFNDFVLETDF